MKQSVEKQIKSAFESWDNKENTIGFDKAALWNSMQKPKKNKLFIVTWFRVAAIAIILLLLGAWGHSYRANQCLQMSNNQLINKLNQAKASKTQLAQKEVETKIIYKTQIKTIESEQAKITLINLAAKLENVSSRNASLIQQVNKQELANNSLNDSINRLIHKLDQTNQWYALQLEKIKQKNQSQGLSIDIDEAALMALSENQSKDKNTVNRSNKKLKITFKNNSRESETSAPLFKDFTMK
jgi:hypothetical protein